MTVLNTHSCRPTRGEKLAKSNAMDLLLLLWLMLLSLAGDEAMYPRVDQHSRTEQWLVEQAASMQDVVCFHAHDWLVRQDERSTMNHAVPRSFDEIRRPPYHPEPVAGARSQFRSLSKRKVIECTQSLWNLLMPYGLIGRLSLDMVLSLTIETNSMPNECIELFNTLSTFVQVPFNKGGILFGTMLQRTRIIVGTEQNKFVDTYRSIVQC